MSRKKYSPEQIIIHMKEVEVLCSQGNIITEAVRRIRVTEQTYYRWRKQYGGMAVTDAKKLKEPERENARSKNWLLI